MMKWNSFFISTVWGQVASWVLADNNIVLVLALLPGISLLSFCLYFLWSLQDRVSDYGQLLAFSVSKLIVIYCPLSVDWLLRYVARPSRVRVKLLAINHVKNNCVFLYGICRSVKLCHRKVQKQNQLIVIRTSGTFQLGLLEHWFAYRRPNLSHYWAKIFTLFLC